MGRSVPCKGGRVGSVWDGVAICQGGAGFAVSLPSVSGKKSTFPTSYTGSEPNDGPLIGVGF